MIKHSLPKIVPHGQTITISVEDKIEMDASSTPIIIDGTLEIQSKNSGSITADNILITPRGHLKTNGINLEAKNNIQILGRWDLSGYTNVKCRFFYTSNKVFNQNWSHLRKQVQNIALPEDEKYPNGYVHETVQRIEELPLEDAHGSIIKNGVS